MRFALLTLFAGLLAAADPLIAASGAVPERIAAIAADRLAVRNATRLAAPATFAIDATLPAHSYRIAEAGGGVQVAGHDGAALIAGAGRWLRDGNIANGSFTASAWRGTATPTCTFRSAYLATHFNNWYEAAPIDEVCTYIEDLGLWGYNIITVHYPTWQFAGLEAARSKAWLDRVRAMFTRARACGLRVGMVQVPNQGFSNTPKEWRGVKVKGGAQGNLGVNTCPSKPEVFAGMVTLYDGLFRAFADTGCDELILWPYDEGGCHCADCVPWGGTMYLKLGKAIAAQAREHFPQVQVTVSTWRFANDNDKDPDGEWSAFHAALGSDHAWAQRVMADGGVRYFPKFPLENGTPGNLPLVSFPEISMFDGNPWGAKGMIPGPTVFHQQWQRLRKRLSGGMVYSEGIFEDINKVLWAGWWWDGDAKPEALVRAYAAWEYGPAVADDVVAVMPLLGKVGKRGEEPPMFKAEELLTAADAKLDERVRTSWRWRLLRLRTVIDAERHRRGGKDVGPVLRDAYAELTRIYHAENAHGYVKPPRIP